MCPGSNPDTTVASSSSSSTAGPIQSKLSHWKQHRVTEYFCTQGYCCRSESIKDDNVWEYRSWQAAEAGEEYDSQLEWLSNELSEDNPEGAPGSNKGVSPSSPSKYFALTRISNGWPISIQFIHPTRDGFAPDVRHCYGDVRSSLVRPGVSGIQEECLENQLSKDHHS